MTAAECCILFNQPGANALPDELDILDQVDYVERHLQVMGISTCRKGITTAFMDEMAELQVNKPDFVFNLVESINNKGELVYFIPAMLNMYSIPYTGSPLEAVFITTSKSLTDRILVSSGITTPAVFKPSCYNDLIPGKQYILKPVWEDGSLGITAESVFTYSPEDKRDFEDYNDSHWLIQEYIEGREFNISILAGKDGPEVLPPAEIVFKGYDGNRPRIVDFSAKWDEGSFEFHNTVREFPGETLDNRLKDNLIAVVLKCWQVFSLRGYARVDIRVDDNGKPYVIEVNSNPCIAPDGGFVAATAEAGYRFTDVLERIIGDLNT